MCGILSAALCFLTACSHHLRHETAHFLRGLLLHLPCDVGIGAERKASVVVAQHRGYCFHIHTVLQCQGRECVSQVVEPDMLQPRVLEDPLVECYDRVGVIHFTSPAGREHPRIVGVFGVFLLQQLHGILRNGHLSDGIPGFGLAQNEVSLCVPAGLLTDGDGAVGFVKVAPLERDQLTLSQSADQFQIEHRQGITPLGCI